MKNNKSLLTIIAILGVAVLLLLVNTCRINRNYANQHETIDSLQLANQTLDSITNKQGETILTQEAIITGSTDAIDALTDTIFDLKAKDARNQKTIAYYKNDNVVILNGVNVPYLDSAYMKYFSDSVTAQCQEVIRYMQDSMVHVGMKAGDSTQYYSISQTVNKSGITIDSLSIPNTLQLRFVEKKNGFLKPKSIEVQFFNSNPLVKTTSSNSVIYRPKKKSFLTRVVLPVAVGVGVGLLISK
jgi:hypothetical protein